MRFKTPKPRLILQSPIAALTGASSELVTIRRLFIRATGTISPNSKVHVDVVEFQRRAGIISLELELAKGADLYGGRAELTALLERLSSAIEIERRKTMN